MAKKKNTLDTKLVEELGLQNVVQEITQRRVKVIGLKALNMRVVGQKPSDKAYIAIFTLCNPRTKRISTFPYNTNGGNNTFFKKQVADFSL